MTDSWGEATVRNDGVMRCSLTDWKESPTAA